MNVQIATYIDRYARENPNEKLLEYICKNCDYSEPIINNDEHTNCVYKNEIKLAQTQIKIDPSITNDPTYSRTKNLSCPECGYREAIYFQNPNLNDSSMKLIFVCCRKTNNAYCGKWWFQKEESKIN